MSEFEKTLNAKQLEVVAFKGGDLGVVHSRENRNKLHSAVYVEYERICKQNGRPYSGLSVRYFDEDTRCTAKIPLWQEDGSDLVYIIRCYLHPDGTINTEETTEIDSKDEFWLGKLQDYYGVGFSRIVRANNHHYYIGEVNNHPKDCKGFGGREWRVEFFDGRIVATDNLWSQGMIPPAHREALPDNAKLIDVTAEKFKEARNAFNENIEKSKKT